ncbi:hypothetical protein MPER_12709, partial [Moniliophthora perniciosa FA553]
MSFQGSSGFIIENGNFTNVEETRQVNHIQGNLYMIREEERERTIWDEFTRVPLGKVRIKRSEGDTECSRYDFKKGRWKRVNAHRTINVASIQGEHPDLEFLYITYSGPDAFKAFDQDLEQFSRTRNLNVAQLFGYNDGQFALPALIFYDALVPAARIWERNGFSSLLLTYFHYLFEETCAVGSNTDLRELWLNPGTGTLCIGPYVGYSSSTFRYLLTYSDSSILISYLTQTLSAQNIIRGICGSSKWTWEWVANEDVIFALSSLPGTVYSKAHRGIIARWPGDIEKWYYRLWETVGLPDEIQASRVELDDGSVRFTVMPSQIQHLREQAFSIYYDLLPEDEWINFVSSWLSQACCVLNQCGFQEGNLEDYCILAGFRLYFRCEDELSLRISSDVSNSSPVYLFIRPIPRPSDQAIWNAWLQGQKYFWSFDDAGRGEISQDIP